jgi:3beta-hydroxy-delta5-steroid dehydrogenase/steroid delta-isomerase
MTLSAELGPVVLVTGGAGFFGRALVRRLLDDGLKVRVFDLASHPELDARAELVKGDLRDKVAVSNAVKGTSTVFHAAALINLCGVASEATRKMVHDVNVGGTGNVIDACVEHGVPRLVYTSSNNVVFDREIVMGDETEAYATDHFDLYTETKILAEKRVLAAASEKLRTCALRPGGIWGPGTGGVMLDKVLEQVAQNTLVARIGVRGCADNTHVTNLAEGEILAAQALNRDPKRVNGQAYFLTDGEPMDPVEWFRPLFDAIGQTMPTRILPTWLMYVVGYSCEWLARLGGPKPLLTRVEVLKVTREHSFRIDKARDHLGYKPLINTRDGLLALVPWAQDYVAQKRSGAQTAVST